jgi:energy-coupling factor transport system permease protein
MSTRTYKQIPGRFIESDSFLHRLDPRTKLIIFPTMIITCFAVREPSVLILLAVVLMFSLRYASVPLSVYLRMLRSLRFLFAFTLLVFLLFTPGYTFLGIPWLSRDGLAEGVEVCIQLALALGFSMVLSMATSPAALAIGAEKLLAPLRLLRVPVGQIGQSLRLVLYFLDILFEKIAGLSEENRGAAPWRQRLGSFMASMGHLLSSMLDLAEEQALKMSRGEPLDVVAPEQSVSRLSGRDFLVMFLAGGTILVIVGVLT